MSQLCPDRQSVSGCRLVEQAGVAGCEAVHLPAPLAGSAAQDVPDADVHGDSGWEGPVCARSAWEDVALHLAGCDACAGVAWHPSAGDKFYLYRDKTQDVQVVGPDVTG